jgi:plasmid stabilization system protein ParE
MDFKIIWSDAAIADFQDIWAYVAQHDPDRATRIGRGILEHVRVLATFPYIGPAYPRESGGTLREIVFGPYRIFYDVSGKSQSVEILHVWHGARDEPTFENR